MAEWARLQGIDPSRVTAITDETEPVDPARIKRAVRDLTRLAVVEQLLVYFAGHGVNLGRQEYWLLSDAFDDPDAAINLAASRDLAAICGIPHVVFISDACRTAAEGIHAQAIRGSVIFGSPHARRPKIPSTLSSPRVSASPRSKSRIRLTRHLPIVRSTRAPWLKPCPDGISRCPRPTRCRATASSGRGPCGIFWTARFPDASMDCCHRPTHGPRFPML